MKYRLKITRYLKDNSW